ncbi:GTP-binding protein ryh1-like [Gigantopelta aegis]|uniref:GTP-binding protein ryh1-like n=1 Tax=Gigantopelta aegis TaxID=1735272 RepID=UPI001B8882E7|nr:GTP-binding protein ryh1-like [Gigantopelta aegis]
MAAVKNLRSSLIKEFEEITYAKVVLLGSMAVGKTSLVKKFCFDKFKNNQPSTIHVDFATVKVLLPDMNKPIVLQIWDTVGQERFSNMNVSFMRRAAAAIVIYNVTDRESFFRIDEFLSDIERVIPEAEVVIVGNKEDLGDRVISSEEGETLAKSHDYEFMETSALTGHNVDSLFHGIARALYKKNLQAKNDVLKLTGSATQKKKSSCCKS